MVFVRGPVQRSRRTAVRDLHRDLFLPAAQGGKVRHSPIEASHRQKTLHHPGRLSERKAEQNLHHEAKLKGRIAEDRRPAVPPGLGAAPRHVLVEPDQQRTALLQRLVVARPRRRAVAGGFRLAHPSPLSPWIGHVNPARRRTSATTHNEGARFWLSVMNKLRNRGVQDIPMRSAAHGVHQHPRSLSPHQAPRKSPPPQIPPQITVASDQVTAPNTRFFKLSNCLLLPSPGAQGMTKTDGVFLQADYPYKGINCAARLTNRASASPCSAAWWQTAASLETRFPESLRVVFPHVQFTYLKNMIIHRSDLENDLARRSGRFCGSRATRPDRKRCACPIPSRSGACHLL